MIEKFIDKMDHTFIIDKNDPLFNDFKMICKKGNLKLYIVDFSPSFEALAKYFFECMEKIIADINLEKQIKVTRAEVTGEYMTVIAVYTK